MLLGYLRLTEAAGLGAGEPLAPRRAIRCFARLCLNAEEEGRASECCGRHASAFRGSYALLNAPGTPLGIPSHSDSELPQVAASCGRPTGPSSACSPGRQAGSAGKSSASPGAVRPVASHRQLPRALRHRYPASRQCMKQCRAATDGRVLNAFGHLYVYACMRVEQELSLRGAWEPDGADPPLPSPRHGNHLLPHFRRHHHSSRGPHGHILSPRAHGRSHSRHSVGAGVGPQLSAPLPHSSHQQQPLEHRSVSLDDKLEQFVVDKPVAMSPSRSTAGPEARGQETSLPPTSGAPSLVPSPRISSCSQPAPAFAPPGCRSRQPGGEQAQPIHRRAHLCFGDALKEVRNAVDLVLSDGTLQTVQDMEAICRGCLC